MAILASRLLSDTILSLGPDLYWPLNADYGITDQSGKGNNGTNQGSLSLGGSASLTYDSTDSATDFNGSSQYVTSSYAWPTVGTVVGILNRDVNTALHSFFGDTSSFVRVRYASGSNAVEAFANVEGPTSLGTTSTPGNTIAWAITYDQTANTMRLYPLGLGNTEASYFTTASFTGNFQLGAGGSGPTDFFDGKMSHVAVYARKLRDEEIRRIYNRSQGRKQEGIFIKERLGNGPGQIISAGPELYWPLNQDYGVEDLSGNARHGTPSNDTSSIGSQASMSPHDPDDSSTLFSAAIDRYIDSSYNPFTTSSTITIVGMANTSDSTQARKVLFGSDGTNPPSLAVTNTETIEFWWTSVGGGGAFVQTWPGLNQTVTFALTIVEATNSVSLTINGGAPETITPAGDYSGTNSFVVGKSPAESNTNWIGTLAHFAIYNGALTETEVDRIHNAMIKGPPGVIIEAGG